MMPIILLTLFFVTAYVLITPVVINFSFASSRSRDLQIKIFPFNFRIPKSKKPVKKEKIDFVLLFINEPKTLKQVLYLCSKIAMVIVKSKYHSINISLKGGFGTPDITGILSGAIEVIKPVFGKNTIIAYYPNMTTPSVNFHLNAQVKLHLYSVLAKTLPLLFSLPILEIARILIKIKKGEYNVGTT